MGEIRSAEAISLAYFLFLSLLAWVRPATRGARLPVTAASGVAWMAVALAVAAGRAPDSTAAALFRDLLPILLLLGAYWLPRWLVTHPHRPLERWLLETDGRVLDTPLGRALRVAPRPLREGMELAYLMVYPLVPVSLGLLLAAGLASEVDRFWTTVLAAEYVCYGLLPVFPTRPPRAIEFPPRGLPASAIGTLNAWVLARASNQWNTFPSGHVAGAFACALAVAHSLPLAGIVLTAVALLIAVASVAGRYHYVADALAGMLLAVAVSAFVR